MSKFQRLLKAAESEVDTLDQSVILAFELAISMPSDLQKRWPNVAPAVSNPSLEVMESLVADRIQSSSTRGAQLAEELFEYLSDVIRKIRDDDGLLSSGLDLPTE